MVVRFASKYQEKKAAVEAVALEVATAVEDVEIEKVEEVALLIEGTDGIPEVSEENVNALLHVLDISHYDFLSLLNARFSE